MLTNLFPECEQLSMQVAPELFARPFYLLTACDCCDLPLGTFAAFTPAADRVDICSRQRLIDAGQWRGPGTVICFAEPEFRYWHGEQKRLAVLLLTLHELGHNLPALEVEAMPVDHEPTEFDRIEYSQFLTDWREQPRITNKPAWFPDHGDQFTRVALHLHWRANRHGWQLPIADLLCAGFRYSLSSPAMYAAALGDEFDRMADATFAEIAAEPFPQAFNDLFSTDFTNWKTGIIA